jgi:hypothetical protein
VGRVILIVRPRQAITMDIWEKFKIVSAVFVPAAITLVGHWYTSAIAEQEVQAKFVELGVTILQAPPSESTANLRAWATSVLNRYSGVPLSSKARRDLIDSVPIPTPDNRETVGALELHCTCYSGRTFCFLSLAECQSLNASHACEVRYSGNLSFNVQSGQTWTKESKGWSAKTCLL